MLLVVGYLFILFICDAMLRMEHNVLCRLGKCFTNELHIQPNKCVCICVCVILGFFETRFTL